MTTLFISDLHLDVSRPEMTQCFLAFLKNQASFADALYILGDFFEVWIGDDETNPFIDSIISGLKTISDKGIPLYFIHGNRDFLIGKTFTKKIGCTLLPDPTVIDLYGEKVLLMHGDTLCLDDKAYLRFRCFAHSTWVQTFFLCLPFSFRQFIAKKIRGLSSHRGKKILHTPVCDVTQEEVTRVMTKQKVKTMIHGHTHRPQIHDVNLGKNRGKRIVLGAWEGKGNVLVCDKKGNKHLNDVPCP